MFVCPFHFRSESIIHAQCIDRCQRGAQRGSNTLPPRNSDIPSPLGPARPASRPFRLARAAHSDTGLAGFHPAGRGATLRGDGRNVDSCWSPRDSHVEFSTIKPAPRRRQTSGDAASAAGATKRPRPGRSEARDAPPSAAKTRTLRVEGAHGGLGLLFEADRLEGLLRVPLALGAPRERVFGLVVCVPRVHAVRDARRRLELVHIVVLGDVCDTA